MKTKEQLINHIEDRLASARRAVANFAKHVDLDPASAVRSIDDYARETARLQLAALMKRTLEKQPDLSVNEIRSEACDNALRCARNLTAGKSTSTGTNLLETAVAAAWAELVDWIGE